MNDNPLGKPSRYADTYSPQLLYAVDRADARGTLGLDESLPFGGVDLWNAWELGWLDDGGRPVVATATFVVPAASPRLVESKSLKLYLNSFAMSRYPSAKDVSMIIAGDLTRTAGAAVDVDVTPARVRSSGRIHKLPGRCVDYEDVGCDRFDVDASLLAADDGAIVSESLHSHVLRSLCPVTGQPDLGSVLVTYHGPRIDAGSLFRYLASYRRHGDFHEACVERIFCDIRERCAPEQLTVYARYNRRGGLDINPFRSDFEPAPAAIRLWRQ